jgi:hypothetical protein
VVELEKAVCEWLWMLQIIPACNKCATFIVTSHKLLCPKETYYRLLVVLIMALSHNC